MTTLTELHLVQLVTLRAAVRLEKLGMVRSRRPSAKALAIAELGLDKNADYDTVIAALSAKIKVIG
jgi:hypothetical protein